MSNVNFNQSPKGWATKWTNQEDEILINNYTSKTVEEIMEMLPNRSKKAIFSRAHKLKLKYHKYNENYFNDIDNSTKAYWLGFLYTDGYVSSVDNRWGVELSYIDFSHLEKLNQDLDSNIQIKTRKRDDRGKSVSGRGTIKSATHSCMLTYNNKKMHTSLVDKGVVPNKTKIMNFPKDAQVPRKYLRDFIRGLYDGDGCYCRHGNKVDGKEYTKIEVSFTCASYDFILRLQSTILEECGVNMNIRCVRENELWVLRTSKKKNVVDFLQYLYYDEDVRCLFRKKEKSKELLGYCLPQ